MQIMAPKKTEKKNKQTCCSSTPIRSLLITITNPGFFEKDSLAMTLQQQNAVDEQFIQHWKWGTKTTSFKGFHLSPSQRQLFGFQEPSPSSHFSDIISCKICPSSFCHPSCYSQGDGARADSTGNR